MGVADLQGRWLADFERVILRLQLNSEERQRYAADSRTIKAGASTFSVSAGCSGQARSSFLTLNSSIATILAGVGYWRSSASGRRNTWRKLEQIKQTGIENLLVCIDAKRCCAEGELPPTTHVIRYRGRMNPRDILAVIERS